MTSVPATAPNRSPGLVSRTLVAAASTWAAAWSAFALANTTGGDWRGVLIGAAFVAGVCAPVAAAWRFPRVGGALLLALGLWGWGFFHSRAAMLGLSIPAILLGLCFIASGAAGAWQRSRARRRARAGRAQPP
ncbi:MAG TPA: hypothetical protein VFF69_04120 [Phycisphaerales bacterium]|nr:hypothetical protein [Phycisphaerales bacterium]